MVMKYQVPYNAGNFLTSWDTISFLTRTLLHVVSLFAGNEFTFYLSPQSSFCVTHLLRSCVLSRSFIISVFTISVFLTSNAAIAWCTATGTSSSNKSVYKQNNCRHTNKHHLHFFSAATLKKRGVFNKCTYTGLFMSTSGISELECATTKTDMAERSISIGRESLQVFFFFFLY